MLEPTWLGATKNAKVPFYSASPLHAPRHHSSSFPSRFLILVVLVQEELESHVQEELESFVQEDQIGPCTCLFLFF